MFPGMHNLAGSRTYIFGLLVVLVVIVYLLMLYILTWKAKDLL